MAHSIYIIDNDDNLKETLNRLFKKEKNYKFKKVDSRKIDIVLKKYTIFDNYKWRYFREDILEVCKRIRANEDNSITPTIVISSNIKKQHRVEVLKECVEHYIKVPIDEEYLYYTVCNIIRLLYVNRRVSPLTGLPGNVQIQAEMKKRLLNNEGFVMLYLDLDNFKAYNDVYGFLNGDEIIKFTAKTIVNNVEGWLKEKVCWHIGGDDFDAIVSIDEDYEKICQNIIGRILIME